MDGQIASPRRPRMGGLSPVLAVATAQASLAVWPWELLPTVIYYSALVETPIPKSTAIPQAVVLQGVWDHRWGMAQHSA